MADSMQQMQLCCSFVNGRNRVVCTNTCIGTASLVDWLGVQAKRGCCWVTVGYNKTSSSRWQRSGSQPFSHLHVGHCTCCIVSSQHSQKQRCSHCCTHIPYVCFEISNSVIGNGRVPALLMLLHCRPHPAGQDLPHPARHYIICGEGGQLREGRRHCSDHLCAVSCRSITAQ
jgi:hypothetical protein